MYKRADIMAYAKNHTQKGRFSIQRERERGSRTRRTHFRLYNSYSMRFAQTRKQKSKKVKRNPLAPMTGTRGSHVERRKLHLCSAAHLSAAAVSDGSKVLVSTPHRLTRPSSMAPSSLYLLPSSNSITWTSFTVAATSKARAPHRLSNREPEQSPESSL